MEDDEEHSLIIAETKQALSNMTWLYWLPIVLEKYDLISGYQWMDDRRSSSGGIVAEAKGGPWNKAQPNEEGLVKCAYARRTRSKLLWYDSDCERTVWSICDVPLTQTYYLRGYNPTANSVPV